MVDYILSENIAANIDANFIDDAGSNVFYFGWVKSGYDETNVADAVWKILKVYKDSTVWKRLWADGNKQFDNIWDDRAILTYAIQK